MNRQKKILVCPLDWGLGHATRCMPLIAYFIEKQYEVIVAGNSTTNKLIQSEFPALQYLDLKGYNVQYASSKFLLPFKIFIQIPKLLSAISYEQRWLRDVIEKHEIDMVISDNRYGLYSDKIKSIFITHQLQIAVPQSGFLEKIVNRINHRFINKFSAVWVPDYEDNAMAGKLSVTSKSLHDVKYVGNLSRFRKAETTQKKYDVAIVLSGPEPQRTILENMILHQIEHSTQNILLVRGKPHGEEITTDIKHISIVNHLPKDKLQTAILQSDIIICRSGYSTIMDLIKLNKHAILIPTPGQTEQEYLALYLMTKKWFIYSGQNTFNFEDKIKAFNAFDFTNFTDFNFEKYKEVIDELSTKF